MSERPRISLTLRSPIATLLLCLVTSSIHSGTPWRPVATAAQGRAGVIEGQITLKTEGTTRTGERYVDDAGVPQDIPRVPVVVRVESPAAAGGAAKASGPLEIAQRGRAFSQLLLVVPIGASVEFPNGDPLFHNVFSYSKPKRFDLGRYKRGESKAVVFDKPGYVKVMCDVHKWMRTAIVVVDNPFYAVVSDDGRFRIDGVPPGHHRVVVEHFDRRAVVVEVDVTPGGTARVDASL